MSGSEMSKFTVTFDDGGYVNATALACSFDKRLHKYTATQKFQVDLDEVAEKLNVDRADLWRQGASSKKNFVSMHPLLGHRLALWAGGEAGGKAYQNVLNSLPMVNQAAPGPIQSPPMTTTAVTRPSVSSSSAYANDLQPLNDHFASALQNGTSALHQNVMQALESQRQELVRNLNFFHKHGYPKVEDDEDDDGADYEAVKRIKPVDG